MYKCNNCEYTSITKLWKCPSCWEFWSFVEDKANKKSNTKQTKASVKPWSTLETKKPEKTRFFELDNKELKRVYQNWIKSWWVYLLWGQPWIWKSTIILQIIQDLINSNKNIRIWYFSWEESSSQIFERLTRLFWENSFSENIKIYTTTNLEDIITTIEHEKYDFIVVDSIQTVYSSNTDSIAGSPQQVKFVSEKISEFCTQNNISSFLIWHVTKWWEIAWPKYLEHIVDVVTYLEWDRFWQYRFLRAMKNRFGNTDDVGIFEMGLFWLQAVYDIKERIINAANTAVPWSVLTIWIDNGRPVIVNLEVLLNKTKYKFPQRNAIWIDSKRLDLVVALLERYLKLNLGLFDIYVNLPGEFKFYDSGLDLAIAMAIISQYKNQILDKKNIYLWELWLGWQVLPSKLHQKRKNEIPEGFEFVDKEHINNISYINNII